MGKVYVSPTCRTRQMADIMFGEEYQVVQELIYTRVIEEKYHEHHALVRRELYTKPTMRGRNRIIIAHANTLLAILSRRERIGQGDAMILKPSDDWKNIQNDFQVEGFVRKQKWLSLHGSVDR